MLQPSEQEEKFAIIFAFMIFGFIAIVSFLTICNVAVPKFFHMIIFGMSGFMLWQLTLSNKDL